jgi:hypothetical protein
MLKNLSHKSQISALEAAENIFENLARIAEEYVGANIQNHSHTSDKDVTQEQTLESNISLRVVN